MREYLYFSAPWCTPCQILGPVMQEVNDKIPVTKINIDEEFEKASEYKVRNVPTVILIENGKETQRFVGIQPKDTYLNV